MKEVTVDWKGELIKVTALKTGGQLWLHFDGRTHLIEESPSFATSGSKDRTNDPIIRAPMPGKIIKVHVQTNDKVEKDQVLVVMEAMKMEYTLKAGVSGQVEKVQMQEGDQVNLGQELVRIQPEASE